MLIYSVVPSSTLLFSLFPLVTSSFLVIKTTYISQVPISSFYFFSVVSIACWTFPSNVSTLHLQKNKRKEKCNIFVKPKFLTSLVLTNSIIIHEVIQVEILKISLLPYFFSHIFNLPLLYMHTLSSSSLPL